MVEPLIRDGETMPFYRAYDHVGGALAEKLAITEAGAKKLLADTYREAEGRELYEAGKALEERFHRPRREAEIAQSRARRESGQQRQRSL